MNNNDRIVLQGTVHEEEDDSEDEVEVDETELSSFDEPLNNQQWDRVIELAQSNDGPREAKREVDDDDNAFRIWPLELACKLNAPYAVVEAILNAYPRAVTSIVGCAAIHQAARNVSDINVMKLLLRADPVKGAKRKTFLGTLPIHELLRYNNHISTNMVNLFLDANPRGLTVKDPEEMTLPLHDACMNHAVVRRCGNKITKLLLEAYPEGAQTEDLWGCLPIHYFVQYCSSKDALRVLIEAHPEGVKHADQDGRLPIHHAVQHSSSVEDVKVLVEAYPEGLRAKDNNGNYPIHLLCGTSQPYRRTNQKPEDVVKIMKVLLLAAPDTVVSTTQDQIIDRSLLEQKNNQHSSEQGKLYYSKEIAKHYGKPSEVISLLEQYEQNFFVSLALKVVGHQKADKIVSS